MSPKDLEDYFGSRLEAAKVLGLTAPAIYIWFDRGFIPEPRQYQIELATGGKLKADKPAIRYTKEVQLAEKVKDLERQHRAAERKLKRLLEKQSA